MSASTSNASNSSSSPSKSSLPPGMVIGPDGKPCKICTAFRNWKPHTDKPKQQTQTPSQGATAPGQKTAAMMAAFASGTGFASTSQQTTARTPTPPPVQEQEYMRPANCPPDVEQLGSATWTFLHTTAAYYPDAPTMAHRVNMLSLLRALPVLYPCSTCATHLGEEMKTRPPDVSSRGALSRWLCEQHNAVNARLGKERFECTVEKLDERWKDGPADGSCD